MQNFAFGFSFPGGRWEKRVMAVKESSEGAIEVSSSLCASDLVKCKVDGEKDWKTLANIITANLLGEVLCASYADYKYGRRPRDFKPDINWKFSYEEKDVLVFAKQHLSEPNVVCFMGRSVFDFPVTTIATLIKNLENHHRWSKFLVEARDIELLSESDNHRDFIGHYLYETKHCLVRTRRDLVVYVHNNYVPEKDRFTQAAISVDHRNCPVIKNVTRAQCCLGSGWVVESFEGHKSKSLVSFVCNIDLKGAIPPIIMNRFLQRQPMAIHFLRQCVMEDIRHKPFFFTQNFTFRTSSSADNDRTDEDSEQKKSPTLPELSSVDLGGSFVLMNSTKYEESVGIAEFIGNQAVPKQKRRRCSKHRLFEDLSEEQRRVAQNESRLVSSDSCEECRICNSSGSGRERYSYRSR